MKIVKLKVHLHTGFVRAVHRAELTLEMDDDADEKEISDAANELTQEWANDQIEYGWEIESIETVNE